MPEIGEEIAIMHTNFGDIFIKLFGTEVPRTVENFVTHSRNGYYDGITFHRIIPDFMIQGGDPEGTGCGGESIWGAPFQDEFDVSLRNYRGALSMANAGPNTNGSQFFIVQCDEVYAPLFKQMEGHPYFPDEVI
ncbi:MAG: peptidylprolyl isomerase, partial [Clostridia bacterium]|nr:peptidylprolyl isomerase [Clostridia bacterium]